MIDLKTYLDYQHNVNKFEKHYAEIVEFNKVLIEKYPWIAIRECDFDTDKYYLPADYDYAFTWFDDIPYGWALAFGMDLLDEIQEDLVKNDFVDYFSPVQIKEKWGSIRIYTTGIPMNSKIYDIIRKYEDISEKTCIICGEQAKYLTTGWIMPICEDCKNDHPEWGPVFDEIKE